MEAKHSVPILSAEEIFGDNKDFFIHLSTDFTDYEGKLHIHEFAEISHIASGEAEHEIGGVRYKVNRGDLIAIPKGVAHTFRPTACDEPFVAYDLMFTENFFSGLQLGEDLRIVLASVLGSADTFADMHLSGVGYQLFGEIFYKIYTEFLTRGAGYTDLIRAYLCELLINLYRKLKTDGISNIPQRLKSIVRNTVSYIEEHFREHLTIDMLSSRVFLSNDYLGRLFKEITGMTIGAYIQKVRLDLACKLLADTDKTVSEIAELSGFGDIKSFYTVFKRELKVTPAKYRST